MNTDNEDHKGIFLAESGLYEIIKNERYLHAAAEAYDVNEIEEAFNRLIDTAVKDYNAFTAAVTISPSHLEIELMTNFIEFFEYVIDVKKKEDTEKKAVAAAAALIEAQAIATAAAAAVNAGAIEEQVTDGVPTSPKKPRKAK